MPTGQLCNLLVLLGETGDFCYNIVKDPVHIHDLNATILNRSASTARSSPTVTRAATTVLRMYTIKSCNRFWLELFAGLLRLVAKAVTEVEFVAVPIEREQGYRQILP